MTEVAMANGEAEVLVGQELIEQVRNVDLNKKKFSRIF